MLFANIMGTPDVLIVAGVIILLFGGAKLPGFMRSLGDGIKEFKKATTEISSDSTVTATPEAVAHPVSAAEAVPEPEPLAK